MNPENSGGATSNILVIDDELEIAEVVTEILMEVPGRKVFQVASPSEAYMRSITTKFDLVVTDFRMPKTDGVDLVRAIRSQKLNTHTPVLMISGYKEEAIAKMGVLPNVTIMGKPFVVDELKAKVHELLTTGVKIANKPQFNVQILNAILRATEQTLVSFGSAPPFRTEKPFLYNSQKPIQADASAVITVDGPRWTGSVILAFEKTSYLALIADVLRSPQTDLNPDNLSQIGAILQLIYGQARAALKSEKVELANGQVQILSGQGHQITPPENSVTMVIPVEFNKGKLHLLATAI